MERSSAEVEPVAGWIYVAEPSFKTHKSISEKINTQEEKRSEKRCVCILLFHSYPRASEDSPDRLSFIVWLSFMVWLSFIVWSSSIVWLFFMVWLCGCPLCYVCPLLSGCPLWCDCSLFCGCPLLWGDPLWPSFNLWLSLIVWVAGRWLSVIVPYCVDRWKMTQCNCPLLCGSPRKENSSDTPDGTRTRDLSITSPSLDLPLRYPHSSKAH